MFQAPIFVILITAAVIASLSWGVNANIQLLLVLPWTVCSAMIGSAMIHWLYRRCSLTIYHKIYIYDVRDKAIVMESWIPNAKAKCSNV